MEGEELERLRVEIEEAADALRAKAAEVHQLTQRLEALTKDTPAWYAGTRAKVEVRATLEQAVELRRVREVLGERLGE
jgi:hypothetical protein